MVVRRLLSAFVGWPIDRLLFLWRTVEVAGAAPAATVVITGVSFDSVLVK